jgi:flavin reductase (DIM6/NTAB) family NADH-FMN oxidoreductase RutF|tara:strand:- start:159 stop:797 length:639 start_codon:yes stop_codon:yes gene_type:complete
MIFDPNEIPFQETHKLMIGSIVPRPIAFVSTQSKDGKNNVAPFSYFNGVCSKPPTIMFAPARRGWDGEEKDTLINIRDTKEFVVNIVSESFSEKMVLCSTDFDSDVNEFEMSGLTPIASQKVVPPRVGESKVSFECILNQIVEIGDGTAGSGFVVIGTIVLFHIDEEVYEDGRINLEKLQALGRIAGNGYARTTDTFDIIRKIKPDEKKETK